MHRHHRAGLPGQARVPTGTIDQYFLPPPSHPRRAGRSPQAVPAVYGRGGAPRIDSYAGRNGNRGAACDVALELKAANGDVRQLPRLGWPTEVSETALLARAHRIRTTASQLDSGADSSRMVG